MHPYAVSNVRSQIISRLLKEVILAFSPEGALAQGIKGYKPRPQQLTMAQAVADTLDSPKGKLVLEAGTGVGKTFGYLIPALLSGKQVIVSTGSKNLQEQLFYKDIPALLRMLDIAPKVALLKGRNNYLCQLRLQQQLDDAQSLEAQTLDDLLRVQQWATASVDGDLGMIATVSEQSPALGLVASTRETCIGKRCEFYEQCFTRNARLKTLDAKIIVINHHLFFADWVLKDTGFAELLPKADMLVFDEAHQLPDIAVSYFGQQLSLGAMERLLGRIEDVYLNELRDTGQLGELARRCMSRLTDWVQECLQTAQSDWRVLLADKNIAGRSWQLLEEFQALQRLLLAHVGRSELLDDCFEKWLEYLTKLKQFLDCDNPSAAYSLELTGRLPLLRMAPIDVTRECQQLFNADCRWVFTSATLQVNRELRHFAVGLGLQDCREMILDSPFDYQRQALFCVPRQLADVRSDSDYQLQRLVSICLEAISAAKGRTFILFTSHRMLERVALELRGRCNFPLLVQGSAGKQSLLKKFRQLGNAVLLGTGSFWEGVDVRGHLLSCVIIDKLPFVSPDDNLYRARAAELHRRGGDPFNDISLPQAVIALKQGFGRLIRDEHDRGVLILCDNRIVNRPYGSAFLNSLPPMARTRDLAKAMKFLHEIK
ncbi:ATP-dependent DNA helicase [Shewanella yunxiaonensis]|uniref:ATP-dependent DNA helicase n=1 Tax=Shewanella yunxiaonensis TaxID=2829809 RepID=A0ABX7YY42_9GAMM|nr:ATP-dependent DNA helicase [Shewanella yunxiaonensis]QUN07597.1 ATP-dependent DNA helicase [Shewanella yunxiaonensis]